MKTLAFLLLLLGGCAVADPVGANIRNGKGYCPICEMWHDADQMQWPATYKGKTYRFCDPNCSKAFEQDPEKYLKDPNFGPKD